MSIRELEEDSEYKNVCKSVSACINRWE